jgi:hypothetical protein
VNGDVAFQSALVALGGLGMFAGVFALSRRQLLSLRYALGWLSVSAVLVVAAIVLALVGGISDSLPVTPTGLLAAVGLAFVLAITLQLSISLSGHQDAIRELSEANALLEERLARVERAAEARLGDEPSSTAPGSEASRGN